MRRTLLPALVGALLLGAVPQAALAREPAPVASHPLESSDRAVIAHRDGIVRALELRPGIAVADVGAGTGAFMEPIARAVGPTGRYLAVDVDPEMVAILAARARRLGLPQVRVVHSRRHDVRLAPASVDLVVVIDTYHHFDPVAPMNRSLFRALKPGGRLVVVDFDRRPDSPEWVKDHVRADRATFMREIEAAGFRHEADLKVPGLHGHFIARFLRP